MSDNSDWMYSVEGREFGPYSEDDLIAKINRGEIPKTALAHKVGWGSWTSITDAFPQLEFPLVRVSDNLEKDTNAVPGCVGSCVLEHQYGGYGICQNCRSSLVMSRLMAWILDCMAITLAYCILICAMAMALGAVARMLPDWGQQIMGVVLFIIYFAFPILLYLIRDLTFGNRSIGKRLLSLKIIDTRSGGVPDTSQLILRNVPVFIPFSPIFFAFQVGKGKRWGDGMAHTLVVRD